jgi:acetolactate synthase-1/2/3 large subunit
MDNSFAKSLAVKSDISLVMHSICLEGGELMKVSDYIASFLYAQGVHHVFEVIGGMITHIVDSIYRQGKIRLVSTHHEQAAAFAADAMARITGVPGVAMATSGPGATNLLTGIGSCFFDSSPAVFITGQVNRNEQKGTRSVRQLGFQETDIVSIASPITKAAWCAQSPEEIPSLLANAFTLAMSGRPGPVLIDIPMDVQRADISTQAPSRLSFSAVDDFDLKSVQELLTDLGMAQRPLVLVGGGVRSAHATDLFRSFVGKVKIPVVNSLMAVDVLPYAHPLRVGMIGTYGNRWANMAIARSDFLLVLGSRLDIRQTGADTDSFKGSRTIYHVDCDPGEVNNRVTGCHAILAHLQSFLASAVEMVEAWAFPDRSDWLAEIIELKYTWPDTSELQDVPGINPNEFMHQLAAASRLAAAFVVDVGQHQMWAAQSLELDPKQRFLTSGGMGAMGFALPAAVGTALACPGLPVVMIAGDGGFQVNIQELQTILHDRLPIKMVVLNNQCHGMVRQFQQSYFEERYQSTYWGYSAPDFDRVASAYGIDSHTIDDPSKVQYALDRMWHDPKSPFLLQVTINTFANAYPKIAFGRPISEMEPFAKPVEMEGT